MTGSNYMPNVAVWVAFGSTYATPEGSRVWTDVSTYVELGRSNITITRGRADELAETPPSTLTVTFDNKDGRFTAGLATGAYYPNVKVGVPIRVYATRPGGASVIRYLGYVDAWPVEWAGVENVALATVTASSRTARMGNDDGLDNIVACEYRADSPDAYYPLDNPSEKSGNHAGDLVATSTGTAVTYTATGPGTDGISAAAFTGGQYLSTPLAGTAPAGFECFFLRNGNPSTAETVIAQNGGGAAEFVIGTDGKGYLYCLGGLIANTAVSVADNTTHHVYVSNANNSATLVVDGVVIGSAAHAIVGWSGVTFTVGGGGDSNGPANFTGTIAHAAAYFTAGALTTARALAHYTAGITGFAGELSGARVNRYAGYAGIATSEVTEDAGVATIAHIDTTGETPLALLRRVETTENGVLYDGRDGHLYFKQRSARYTVASAFTLDMSTGQVETDYSTLLDRQGMVNEATATLSDGTASALATDATSYAAYGRARVDITLDTSDAGEPTQAASWRVSSYAEPRPRVPAMSVDLLPVSAALLDLIFAADIGTRFTVSNQPANAPATTSDYFLEGYVEVIGPESYVFTFNVSPAEIWDVWTVEDATFGAYDSNPLAY